MTLQYAEPGSGTPVVSRLLNSEHVPNSENRPVTGTLVATSSGLTTATTLYTAGDQLGSVVEVANAARYSGAGLVIQSAVLVDKGQSGPGGVIGAVEAWLFADTVTAAADNAAADFSDADMEKLRGIIEFPVAKQHTSNYVAHVPSVGLSLAVAATSLYVAFITRTTHTAHFGAASNLRMVLTTFPD